MSEARGIVPDASGPASASNSRHLALPLLLAAAVIAAARYYLIQCYGSAIPYMDQWDAEPPLFKAWLRGEWDWGHVFAAHNEHRIALTRVGALCLFVMSGEWNPLHQMLLNLTLHTTTGVVLMFALFRTLPDLPRRAFAFAVATLLVSLPAGWENALWGFQSQVYFSGLLASLGILGLTLAPPLSFRWWGFLCVGGGALLGNAGGWLALPAAAFALLLARTAFRGPHILAASIVGIAAAGTWLLRVEVPYHEYLRARSVEQFIRVFANMLAWPAVGNPLAAVVVQSPLVVWVYMQRRRKRLDATDCAAVGLLLWNVLQSAAVAYNRGNGLPDFEPHSRYQDPLILGTLAQVYALTRLLVLRVRALQVLAVVWIATVLLGATALSIQNLRRDIPHQRRLQELGHRAITAYLNGETRTIDVHPHALHPTPDVVIRVLEDPVLQPHLPAEVQRGGRTR